MNLINLKVRKIRLVTESIDHKLNLRLNFQFESNLMLKLKSFLSAFEFQSLVKPEFPLQTLKFFLFHSKGK